MTIHARLIHSDELGAPVSGLVIQGQHLTGDWSMITPNREQLARLRGNRHVGGASSCTPDAEGRTQAASRQGRTPKDGGAQALRPVGRLHPGAAHILS